MKLSPPHTRRHGSTKRGSSVLIILALLAVMAILIVANTHALHWLKQEINLIDKEQQQKYGQGLRH